MHKIMKNFSIPCNEWKENRILKVCNLRCRLLRRVIFSKSCCIRKKNSIPLCIEYYAITVWYCVLTGTSVLF